MKTKKSALIWLFHSPVTTIFCSSLPSVCHWIECRRGIWRNNGSIHEWNRRKKASRMCTRGDRSHPAPNVDGKKRITAASLTRSALAQLHLSPATINHGCGFFFRSRFVNCPSGYLIIPFHAAFHFFLSPFLSPPSYCQESFWRRLRSFGGRYPSAIIDNDENSLTQSALLAAFAPFNSNYKPSDTALDSLCESVRDQYDLREKMFRC